MHSDIVLCVCVCCSAFLSGHCSSCAQSESSPADWHHPTKPSLKGHKPSYDKETDNDGGQQEHKAATHLATAV